MNALSKTRMPSILTATAVSLVLAACATAPPRDAQLESARQAVSVAHADPLVIGDARSELASADTALAAADALSLAGKPREDVDHQAYLADRYALAAQEHGKLLSSEAAIAQLDNRRNAVLLHAREGDIRRANAATEVKTQEASDARERADRLNAQLAELQATHTDRGTVVTLGDVLFETGRSDLQEGSQRSIGRLTGFLTEHPQRNVRVEGFTDSVGSDGYNRTLSEDRAASVASALTRGGVNSSRIQTEGYGKSYAVASNDTAAGRQQNRRVEVIISDTDQRIAERTR
jgi:outer membrane protein OmpA-like peptidoglycan-associated protein